MQGARREFPDFEAAFQAGEFDFAYMNPYHAVIAAKSRATYPCCAMPHRSMAYWRLAGATVRYKTVKDLDGKNISSPGIRITGALRR